MERVSVTFNEQRFQVVAPPGARVADILRAACSVTRAVRSQHTLHLAHGGVAPLDALVSSLPRGVTGGVRTFSLVAIVGGSGTGGAAGATTGGGGARSGSVASSARGGGGAVGEVAGRKRTGGSPSLKGPQERGDVAYAYAASDVGDRNMGGSGSSEADFRPDAGAQKRSVGYPASSISTAGVAPLSTIALASPLRTASAVSTTVDSPVPCLRVWLAFARLSLTLLSAGANPPRPILSMPCLPRSVASAAIAAARASSTAGAGAGARSFAPAAVDAAVDEWISFREFFVAAEAAGVFSSVPAALDAATQRRDGRVSPRGIDAVLARTIAPNCGGRALSTVAAAVAWCDDIFWGGNAGSSAAGALTVLARAYGGGGRENSSEALTFHAFMSLAADAGIVRSLKAPIAVWAAAFIRAGPRAVAARADGGGVPSGTALLALLAAGSLQYAQLHSVFTAMAVWRADALVPIGVWGGPQSARSASVHALGAAAPRLASLTASAATLVSARSRPMRTHFVAALAGAAIATIFADVVDAFAPSAFALRSVPSSATLLDSAKNFCFVDGGVDGGGVVAAARRGATVHSDTLGEAAVALRSARTLLGLREGTGQLSEADRFALNNLATAVEARGGSVAGASSVMLPSQPDDAGYSPLLLPALLRSETGAVSVVTSALALALFSDDASPQSEEGSTAAIAPAPFAFSNAADDLVCESDAWSCEATTGAALGASSVRGGVAHAAGSTTALRLSSLLKSAQTSAPGHVRPIIEPVHTESPRVRVLPSFDAGKLSAANEAAATAVASLRRAISRASAARFSIFETTVLGASPVLSPSSNAVLDATVAPSELFEALGVRAAAKKSPLSIAALVDALAADVASHGGMDDDTESEEESDGERSRTHAAGRARDVPGNDEAADVLESHVSSSRPALSPSSDSGPPGRSIRMSLGGIVGGGVARSHTLAAAEANAMGAGAGRAAQSDRSRALSKLETALAAALRAGTALAANLQASAVWDGPPPPTSPAAAQALPLFTHETGEDAAVWDGNVRSLVPLGERTGAVRAALAWGEYHAAIVERAVAAARSEGLAWSSADAATRESASDDTYLSGASQHRPDLTSSMREGDGIFGAHISVPASSLTLEDKDGAWARAAQGIDARLAVASAALNRCIALRAWPGALREAASTLAERAALAAPVSLVGRTHSLVTLALPPALRPGPFRAPHANAPAELTARATRRVYTFVHEASAVKEFYDRALAAALAAVTLESASGGSTTAAAAAAASSAADGATSTDALCVSLSAAAESRLKLLTSLSAVPGGADSGGGGWARVVVTGSSSASSDGALWHAALALPHYSPAHAASAAIMPTSDTPHSQTIVGLSFSGIAAAWKLFCELDEDADGILRGNEALAAVERIFKVKPLPPPPANARTGAVPALACRAAAAACAGEYLSRVFSPPFLTSSSDALVQSNSVDVLPGARVAPRATVCLWAAPAVASLSTVLSRASQYPAPPLYGLCAWAFSARARNGEGAWRRAWYVHASGAIARQNARMQRERMALTVGGLGANGGHGAVVNTALPSAYGGSASGGARGLCTRAPTLSRRPALVYGIYGTLHGVSFPGFCEVLATVGAASPEALALLLGPYGGSASPALAAAPGNASVSTFEGSAAPTDSSDSDTATVTSSDNGRYSSSSSSSRESASSGSAGPSSHYTSLFTSRGRDAQPPPRARTALSRVTNATSEALAAVSWTAPGAVATRRRSNATRDRPNVPLSRFTPPSPTGPARRSSQTSAQATQKVLVGSPRSSPEPSATRVHRRRASSRISDAARANAAGSRRWSVASLAWPGDGERASPAGPHSARRLRAPSYTDVANTPRFGGGLGTPSLTLSSAVRRERIEALLLANGVSVPPSAPIASEAAAAGQPMLFQPLPPPSSTSSSASRAAVPLDPHPTWLSLTLGDAWGYSDLSGPSFDSGDESGDEMGAIRPALSAGTVGSGVPQAAAIKIADQAARLAAVRALTPAAASTLHASLLVYYTQVTRRLALLRQLSSGAARGDGGISQGARLFDYAVDIARGALLSNASQSSSANDIEFAPVFQERFPREDWRGLPLPPNAAVFAFPTGMRLARSASPPKPSLLSFNLTFENGISLACGALLGWEKVEPVDALGFFFNAPLDGQAPVLQLPFWLAGDKPAGAPAVRAALAALAAEPLWSPRAILLISRNPFFGAIRATLCAIDALYSSNGSGWAAPRAEASTSPTLSRLLAHLILDVPRPPRGRFSIGYTIGDAHVVIARPPLSARANLDVSLTPLLLALGPDALVATVVALVAETQVALVSSRPSLLLPVAAALLALIAPFSWGVTYIPVLPIPLIDIMGSPSPYLIGWPGSLEQARSAEKGVIFVDLDTGIVHVPPPPSANTLPRVPDAQKKKLMRALMQHAYGHVARTEAERTSALQAIADELENVPLTHMPATALSSRARASAQVLAAPLAAIGLAPSQYGPSPAVAARADAGSSGVGSGLDAAAAQRVARLRAPWYARTPATTHGTHTSVISTAVLADAVVGTAAAHASAPSSLGFGWRWGGDGGASTDRTIDADGGPAQTAAAAGSGDEGAATPSHMDHAGGGNDNHFLDVDLPLTPVSVGDTSARGEKAAERLHALTQSIDADAVRGAFSAFFVSLFKNYARFVRYERVGDTPPAAAAAAARRAARVATASARLAADSAAAEGISADGGSLTPPSIVASSLAALPPLLTVSFDKKAFLADAPSAARELLDRIFETQLWAAFVGSLVPHAFRGTHAPGSQQQPHGTPWDPIEAGAAGHVLAARLPPAVRLFNAAVASKLKRLASSRLSTFRFGAAAAPERHPFFSTPQVSAAAPTRHIAIQLPPPAAPPLPADVAALFTTASVLAVHAAKEVEVAAVSTPGQPPPGESAASDAISAMGVGAAASSPPPALRLGNGPFAAGSERFAASALRGGPAMRRAAGADADRRHRGNALRRRLLRAAGDEGVQTAASGE